MTYSRKTISILSLLLAMPSFVYGQEVQWHHDLNTARALAKNNNRPIVIDFGTANCYWCRQMEATTFREPTIARLLADKFVAVKIDASKDPALARSMSVHAFPTLIVLTPDGKTLGRHEGYAEAAQFQNQLLKALAQSAAIASASCPCTSPPSAACPCVNPSSATCPCAQSLQPKVRMQAADQPAMPPPTDRFILPSPEVMGVAVTRKQLALPPEATVDFDALFARLRQIGVVGLHLERVGSGYRVRIDLKGSANQMTAVEGLGATDGAAIADALAKADAVK
jgi:thioredoxin-related protein